MSNLSTHEAKVTRYKSKDIITGYITKDMAYPTTNSHFKYEDKRI